MARSRDQRFVDRRLAAFRADGSVRSGGKVEADDTVRRIRGAGIKEDVVATRADVQRELGKRNIQARELARRVQGE